LELEEEKLLDLLYHTAGGTEEYDKLQKELQMLQEFTGKKVEMRQVFTKEDRGAMVSKIVGAASVGAVSFGLAWWEKSGNLFTGSSAKTVNGLVGRLGDFIFKNRS
jgi:hypothetical protein